MLGGAFVQTDLSDKQCDDLVMGTEELIPPFLALDPDNIVFKQPGSDNYLCANRDDIKTQMNEPANIVLPCLRPSLALHISPNLVCGLKMNKLQTLGVAYGGYVPLENMVNVIANTTEQVFQIEDYDSPITIKALAGLRLFPEYAPEQVRVPFDPNYDENNDSYIRRLNEWGAQNNEPDLGERWEDAYNLILGASHCQSGYEGQHMYRIVSASNPEYTVNPRLLQRMKDAGCIMADSLPPVTDDTPQIDWQSEYLYQDTAEYTPARRLFDASMEEDESVEEDKDVTEEFRDLLKQQLGSQDGIGPTLAGIISEQYGNRGQQDTLSFSGSVSDRTDIIEIVNQSDPIVAYNEISTNTYVIALTQPSGDNKVSLTHITNLDGLVTSVVDGYPNIIVMQLDDEGKRRKMLEILEYLDDEIETRSGEIEEFVSQNNHEFEVEVKPFLVVVGTIRPEDSGESGEKTRVITILASDLYTALELSQPEWDLWYYNNVVKRITNPSQAVVSPDNIILVAFDIDSDASGINIETTVWYPAAGSILAGDNFSVNIGYLQSIRFPDSASADMEQDGVNDGVLGDSISQEEDSTAQLRRVLQEQLSDREGMGVTLAEAITGGVDRGEQLTLSFSGNIATLSDIFQTLNQYDSLRFQNGQHKMDSYVLAITEQLGDTDYNLTYLTNLNGAFTSLVDGNPNMLVMNIDDDAKREKALNILELMIDDADMKTEEIERFVDNPINDYQLNIDVKPFLIVVATLRPEGQRQQEMSSRIIAVLASDLSKALESSQAEWDQWFYNNVVMQLTNNGEPRPSPDNINLYSFDIYDEVNGINVETSVMDLGSGGSMVQGNNYLLDIGFLQVVRFPVLDSDEISVEGLDERDGEMLSPVASPAMAPLASPDVSFGSPNMTPIASPSISPIPINDLTLNTPNNEQSESPNANLSGGRKRRQTKSKRGRKGKKAGKGEGKRTRRCRK
jgi:hypothetical protein